MVEGHQLEKETEPFAFELEDVGDGTCPPTEVLKAAHRPPLLATRQSV